MKKPPMHGIHGVLDGLISSPNDTRAHETSPRQDAVTPTATPAKQGRPFASAKRTPQVKKEKLTVRVPPDLAESYRQWSWNARSSLSDLIETAMRRYLGVKQKKR